MQAGAALDIVMVPLADRAHAALIPRVTNELPSGTPAPAVLIGPKGLCTFRGRTLAPQELSAAIRDEVKRQPMAGATRPSGLMGPSRCSGPSK